MSNLTNYAENEFVDALVRGQPLGAPATMYFALFTSDPTDTGAAGTEITGGSYARVAVTASLANFAGTQSAGSTTASSGTGGQTSNNIAITFPAPTANWGVATHWALMDASGGGNAWVSSPLTTPKTINNGDPAPSFPIGSLVLTFA